MSWIVAAIRRAVLRNEDCGLDIAIVSYGGSRPEVDQLVQALNAQLRGG
ncbi:MAG: hypothetical protein QGG36_11720 [Pirellulaceae bacterium]|nr:hypothetical protein [Pirellulaceae bacterium]